MNTYSCQLVAAGLSVFFGLTASAAELKIESGRDNTLYESSTGSISNGSGEHVFVGRTSGGAIRRSLLWFDVSAIAPGSTIESVTVTLHMSKTTSGDQFVTFHTAGASWGEGGSNPLNQEGSGAAAQTGDATWLHRFFNDMFWGVAGGDFSSGSRAGLTVGGVGSFTWGSTPGLVADVQSWVDQPSLNFGWVVVGNEAAATTTKRFDSRENPSAGNRPLLTVIYTPPVVPGDANGDGTVTVTDIFYLINHLFAAGPSPVGPADANGDGMVSVSDVFYLINFLFAGGPAPV